MSTRRFQIYIHAMCFNRIGFNTMNIVAAQKPKSEQYTTSGYRFSLLCSLHHGKRQEQLPDLLIAENNQLLIVDSIRPLEQECVSECT